MACDHISQSSMNITSLLSPIIASNVHPLISSLDPFHLDQT